MSDNNMEDEREEEVIEEEEEGEDEEEIFGEDRNNNNEENEEEIEEDEEDKHFSDNEEIEEEECPCLFTNEIAKSFRHALEVDKNALGFDFYEIKKRLSLNFYECIILINYIRDMVRNNKSLITEKTFNSRDELLQFLKESKEFNELNKDHPFWHDPKYLLPTLDDDPILFSFTEDIDDDDEQEKLFARSEFDRKEEDLLAEEDEENEKLFRDIKHTENRLQRSGIELSSLHNE